MPKKCADFLAKLPKSSPPGVIVLFGDEDFLLRESVAAVRRWVLGDDPDEMALSQYDGESVEWASVKDDLITPPFLGDRRLVIVENADGFVTRNRARLEAYVARPSSCAVLVLGVSSWPASTKLAKAVEASGLSIDASAPKAWLVADWVVRWTRERHGKEIDKEGAQWLVELAGTSLGQLDQEIGKLCTCLEANAKIDARLVDRMVAGTRTETAFKLLDMVLEGKVGSVFELLDRQFAAGESPVGILAMLTSQLRRLARAARQTEMGTSTPEALQQAGVPPFAVDKARAQLNHFGRARMELMSRRLLQADLDLKGSSSLSSRTVIERLLVELAAPRTSV